MAYGDFKDLERRTFSDKVLRDKAFNIAKNPKYDGYQRGLASMVYKFFDKKYAGSSIDNNNNYYDRLVGLFGHEFIMVFLLFYVSERLYM